MLNYDEINARIAESVFSVEPREVLGSPIYTSKWIKELNIPDYTKFENMEEILNWLKNHFGGYIEISTSHDGKVWWITVPMWSEVVDGETIVHWDTLSGEETLPLAVCVAILKVVCLWSEGLRRV